MDADWVQWAPALAALIGYGLIRAGVVVWVLTRGGLPVPALGWSGAAGGLAACRRRRLYEPRPKPTCRNPKVKKQD